MKFLQIVGYIIGLARSGLTFMNFVLMLKFKFEIKFVTELSVTYDFLCNNYSLN